MAFQQRDLQQNPVPKWRCPTKCRLPFRESMPFRGAKGNCARNASFYSALVGPVPFALVRADLGDDARERIAGDGQRAEGKAIFDGCGPCGQLREMVDARLEHLAGLGHRIEIVRIHAPLMADLPESQTHELAERLVVGGQVGKKSSASASRSPFQQTMPSLARIRARQQA
jgi:hypothetical protein